ncbi:hypothetical protein [Bradyrhizobium sp. SRS-191]|uniref:hypothetical protein n=1 Tax=Bradyrhizobium sp. SRS-191 TaxID=2962606 RepID=UPI00211DA588|nr:hypothetical protein [Bradyrhizobium sp. SRS-191]
MKRFITAWLASSAAVSAAFIIFMMVWSWLDDGHIGGSLPRLTLVAVVTAVVVQFFYGGVLYLILTRTGLWSFSAVFLAYLLPLVLIGEYGIDTEREAYGMTAWALFALIVSWTFWRLGSAPPARPDLSAR